MSLARKELETMRKDMKPSAPKANFTVIDGRKGEKTVTAEYLNERLNYFYNNGGPIMDI
jgi:hypothetical protein